MVGLLAFSDPPRAEAAESISALKNLGIKVVMLTGDAPETAAAVGNAVGLRGVPLSADQIPVVIDPDRYPIFAGILPEDKFRIVISLQRAGYLVGMCGDGANDAPALRQAQFGIAVSTSTDVAKSAAGIVLTEPGLRGILIAVTEGRVAFQRILTYTIRSIIHKTRQVSFLVAGLMLTGHSILTPTLAVISLITGDFFAMSSTTDNVRPSLRPDSWRIGTFVAAGAILGVVDLAFCVCVLAAGKHYFALGIDKLQTLTMVSLVFSNQAIFYCVRERRRLWSSRPSAIVLACSAADLLIIPGLAYGGLLMTSSAVANHRYGTFRRHGLCVRSRCLQSRSVQGSEDKLTQPAKLRACYIPAQRPPVSQRRCQCHRRTFSGTSGSAPSWTETCRG